MHRAVYGMTGVLISFGLFCSSCDKGVEMPFKKPNVAWSSEPGGSYNYHFKGWHCASRDRVVAILRWEGSGQLSAEAMTIILCLQRDATQEPRVSYRLAEGLLIPTGRRRIGQIQGLEKRSFSCQPLAGERLRVSYDGQIANGPAAAHPPEPRYLRFCLVIRQNDRRISTILRELYPQLKELAEAQEVVTCIAPLLGE